MKENPDITKDVPVITNDVLRSQLVPYKKKLKKPTAGNSQQAQNKAPEAGQGVVFSGKQEQYDKTIKEKT